MKKANKLFILFAAFTLLGITSCKKEFLDVNEDPNSAKDANVEYLLPTAIGYSAYVMGNQYQIVGGLMSQYWTQGPNGSQYLKEDAYILDANLSDIPWKSMYSGPLNDLAYMIKKANTENKPNYAAIGKILMAYDYQVLTDLHGDIPYSEALKGILDDGSNGSLSPKYDKQEDIYKSLIAMVTEATDTIWNTTSAITPGGDDLIYGGDMNLWAKFAYTLRLKMLLRISKVDPAYAQTGIASLYAEGPVFIEDGEDAAMQFTTATYNQNPLYVTFGALYKGNLVASNTSVNFYTNNNDPRIDAFYDAATTGGLAGSHSGVDQGNGENILNATTQFTDFSLPGVAVGGPNSEGDVPVIFMSDAESYFLQAEASALGWSGGDAQTEYENGITASFVHWGFTMGDAANYIAQPAIAFPSGGTTDDQIKAIITQKWASMNGTEDAEAWTEFRRTGYPDFLVPSVSSVLPAGEFPARMLYPSSELTGNPNVPAQPLVTTRMWWDIN